MITTDFRHPYNTRLLSPLAAILANVDRPSEATPGATGQDPAAPGQSVAATDADPRARGLLAAVLANDSRRDTGMGLATPAMERAAFQMTPQAASPAATAAPPRTDLPASMRGMENLYAGVEMRPAPALPPGADPWTGEGFATSRGDWRHAVAGKLLGALAPVPVNPLSAIFGMATQHAPDFTIGRAASPIRAMPGSMPGDRGGLVNVKTGATWTPKSTAQLVAEDKARKAAPKPTVGSPVRVGGAQKGGQSNANTASRGNPTHASGKASGYGGNDRTAVGPGGRLGHI